MTVPRSSTGYVQMQGGYVPHAPQGTPGYQQPQQTQQPQGQPQQQFQQPPLPWQNPAGPGAPMEGAPPPQPQPVQQTQQPQQQQQPAQPQQQPQQQPPAPQGTQQQLQNLANQGVDLNARLNGANVPTELQGRTLGEALQLYNGMRNVVLQQTVPKPQQQTQPQQQSQAQQTQQQQEEWNWRNPQASIAKIVQEQLAPLSQALQPLVLNTQVQQMRTVRDQVAATIPNFAAIEGQVMESLRGADPQVLLNPQAWRLAAESVVGRMALQGQQVPAAQQPAQQPSNPWMQPAQRPGPGQQPMPNLSGFFTEQPTSGAPNAAPPQLTATQQWAAQQMGMSNEDYMAWSAGVPGGAR